MTSEDSLQRNKQNVQAFYDLRSNQARSQRPRRGARLVATLAREGGREVGGMAELTMCRISLRRCGRRSAACWTGWTSSNAVSWCPVRRRPAQRWTYFPGQRPGLRLGELSDEQLEPALVVLQLVDSVRGWCDTPLVTP
jgi:hypothetical protein